MSSSTSEYDSYEHNPYDFIWNKCRQTPFPFGSSMGNPLIYFSEVNPQPQPWKPKPRNDRKEHRNSFANAFKWYLKDQGSNKKTFKDMQGFASWLDNKYSEYLREIESQPVEKATKNAITANCGHAATTPSCKTGSPGKTKKFSRFRSPWGKRRAGSKDDNAKVGSRPESCEFIMQPKEMERPVSEYGSSSCCHKSNSTPTNSPKKLARSQSHTCLSYASERNQIDVTKQEGLNMRKGLHSTSMVLRCEVECQYSSITLHEEPQGISTNQKFPKGVKVICKCVPKDPKSTEVLKDKVTCSCAVERLPSKTKGSKHKNKRHKVICVCSDNDKPSAKKKIDLSTEVCQHCQPPKANIIESGTTDKSCHNHDRIQTVHTTSHGGACVQTSDHSIYLDEEIVNASKRKPIFVRLVYADRVKAKQLTVLQQ